MDRRVLLIAALGLGAFVLWNLLGQRSIPPSGPTTVAQPATPVTLPTTPPVEAVLEQPGLYRAVFTSWGAVPKSWVLLDPHYKEEVPTDHKKATRQIDLINEHLESTAEISFPASDFKLDPKAAWQPQPQGSDGALVYTIDVGDTHVEKRFVPVPGTYQVNLTVTVENRGEKPLSHYFRLTMDGWQDPTKKQGGMFSRRISQNEGMCDAWGKVKKGNLETLLEKKEEGDWGLVGIGAVHWVGFGGQYFLTAATFKTSAEPDKCNVWGLSDGHIYASNSKAQRTVPAHGKEQYEVALFFGPKLIHALDAVTVGGTDAGLHTAVDYGWLGKVTEMLARPMLAALKGIHRVIPNWGFAVIILTIFLKALTWWPTTASMKSMRAMAKLKPDLDKLKDKYGADPQRLQAEQMNLYRKHGVNPLQGCLPILIQLPIYAALYAMLGNSVELYRSAWILWIHDLTAPDPYFVLPLVSGALMFAQQRLSPTPPDPQQKVMMYTMPVMFTAFTIFLPSGLALYMFTNTLLTMFQQWWNNRGEKPARPKLVGKPARA